MEARAGVLCPNCGREPLHLVGTKPPFDRILICSICDNTFNLDEQVAVYEDPKDVLIGQLRDEIATLKDRHGSTLCKCGHQSNNHFNYRAVPWTTDGPCAFCECKQYERVSYENN